MAQFLLQAVGEALQQWRLKGRFPDLARPLLRWLIERTAAERAILVTVGEDLNIDRVRATLDVDGERVQDAADWISPHVIRKSQQRATDGEAILFHPDTLRDRRFRTAMEQQVGAKIHSMLTFWLEEPADAAILDGENAHPIRALLYLDSRFASLSWPIAGGDSLATISDVLTLGLRQDRLQRSHARLVKSLEQEQRRERREPLPAPKVAKPWVPARVSVRELEFHGFRTRCPALIRSLEELEQLAKSRLAILIEGESGTGKEVLARAIHAASERGRFVSVHCGALPESLVEIELFGHVQGAFTGADRDRSGLLDSASGGTVFLDDIGEMSQVMQNALLRVLQSGRYRPVSGTEEKEVDVRILCSVLTPDQRSPQSGEDKSEKFSVRHDLHYRLAGATIVVPPLRERREDIPLLLDIFRQRHSEDAASPLADDLQRAFTEYDWPGNVRELENVVRRMVALGSGEFTVERFEHITGAHVNASPVDNSATDMQSVVDRAEREAIIRALLETTGNKSKAADLLGLSRKTLYRRMEKHGIPL